MHLVSRKGTISAHNVAWGETMRSETLLVRKHRTAIARVMSLAVLLMAGGVYGGTCLAIS